MVDVSRRRILGWTAALGGAYGLGLVTPKFVSFVEGLPLQRAMNSILDIKPVATGLDLGKPVAKLVEAGAIDTKKFIQAHKRRGPMPEWVSLALQGKPQELVLSAENALYNLNLLWPVGLSTRASFNAKSPLLKELPNYASTGGWTLGRIGNGAAYFNKVATVDLSDQHSATAFTVADKVFRPCCGNSAFFQDCNHGSAMLGLIEMAAADGRDEEAIRDLAKVANGFWYPVEYVEMALFFDAVKGTSWTDTPAGQILSSEYSSIRGWQRNVHAVLVDHGIIRQPPRGSGGTGGSGCTV